MSGIARLWDVGKGNPLVAGPINFESGDETKVVLAGVSGYRIVPVWVYIGEYGVEAPVIVITIDGNVSGNLIFKTGIRASFHQGQTVNFHGGLFNLLNRGEGVDATIENTALPTFWYITMGYYLV